MARQPPNERPSSSSRRSTRCSTRRQRRPNVGIHPMRLRSARYHSPPDEVKAIPNDTGTSPPPPAPEISFQTLPSEMKQEI
ncbi:hypothetical protein IMZ48_40600 [Candidatus Bathyarchaeota archaeon]|nr:hypothetical protein [Candidatus Bathyarchaeota archaeon]